MTRTQLLGFTAAIALLLPLAASASPSESGYYLGADVGASLPGSSDFSDSTHTNTADTDTGFVGVLSGGYQFSNNWRVQADFAARLNSVGDITGIGAANPDGNLDVYSLMADAIYGMPTSTKFTPYLGGGVGFASIKAGSISTILGSNIDDTDIVFAYQGIVGVECDVLPHLKADLSYRYFKTANPSFKMASSAKASAEYENHTLTLGLRYIFPGPVPTFP